MLNHTLHHGSYLWGSPWISWESWPSGQAVEMSWDNGEHHPIPLLVHSPPAGQDVRVSILERTSWRPAFPFSSWPCEVPSLCIRLYQGHFPPSWSCRFPWDARGISHRKQVPFHKMSRGASTIWWCHRLCWRTELSSCRTRRDWPTWYQR